MQILCKYTYRNTLISIVLSNIVQLDAEAIVNPANSLMIMGGGVAAAIKRAGGEEIEIEARKYAPVPIGKAIATHGGRLKAKYVIHAPTMERPGMRIPPENVDKAVRAALEKAVELRVKTVALPGMGTGVGGVPYSTATDIMVRAVIDYINRGAGFEHVYLVSVSRELTEEFCRALDTVLSRGSV